MARLLSETADLMEISGADSFRVRSYRNPPMQSDRQRLTSLPPHPKPPSSLLSRA